MRIGTYDVNITVKLPGPLDDRDPCHWAPVSEIVLVVDGIREIGPEQFEKWEDLYPYERRMYLMLLTKILLIKR